MLDKSGEGNKRAQFSNVSEKMGREVGKEFLGKREFQKMDNDPIESLSIQRKKRLDLNFGEDSGEFDEDLKKLKEV